MSYLSVMDTDGTPQSAHRVFHYCAAVSSSQSLTKSVRTSVFICVGFVCVCTRMCVFVYDYDLEATTMVT